MPTSKPCATSGSGFASGSLRQASNPSTTTTRFDIQHRPMNASDLQGRRAATVREHMESENRHDFEATMATFAHPRYELIGTGDVYDGDEAVRGYFAETRRAFPD